MLPTAILIGVWIATAYFFFDLGRRIENRRIAKAAAQKVIPIPQNKGEKP